MSHTAIVFGATGYTGRAVVPQLIQAGVSVVAHIRPDSSRRAAMTAEFEAAGAQVSTAEWTPDAIGALVQSTTPTLVFGLLGITRASAKREAKRTGDDAPTYMSVDFGLTAMAINATAAHAPAARFVYLSSIGTSASASGAYLEARWRTEQHLRASGLAHTIVRPSIIAGDRDETRLGEEVAATVGAGVLGVLGALGARRLKARYSPRTNEELAAGMVRAALYPPSEHHVLESEAI